MMKCVKKYLQNCVLYNLKYKKKLFEISKSQVISTEIYISKILKVYYPPIFIIKNQNLSWWEFKWATKKFKNYFPFFKIKNIKKKKKWVKLNCR